MLVLAALFVVVALVAAALAVDLGALVLEKRSDQRTADLAALDAVRALDGPTPRLAAEDLAVRSATRNGFEVASSSRRCDPTETGATFLGTGERSMLVEVGTMMPGAGGTEDFLPIPCPASPATELLGPDAADAVRVTLSSPVDFSFAPGSQRQTAAGVAKVHTTAPTGPPEARAGVRVGSGLATISTAQSVLLNTLLTQVFSPFGAVPAVSLSAADYTGLAGADVSLGELATELGLAAGTVDEVLAADVTLFQLLDAAAGALDNDGSAAAATVEEIELSVPGTFVPPLAGTVSLGDFVAAGGEVGLFDGSSVADLDLNVLDMIRSAVLLADGDHLVRLPLSASIPGLASVAVDLHVIEAPRTAFGPVGTTAHTAQVGATLDLGVHLALAGIGVADVALPVIVEGGGADATIAGIACDASATEVETVGVDAAGRALSVRVGAFSADVLGGLLGTPVLRISSDGLTAGDSAPPQSFSFTEPWGDQVQRTAAVGFPTLQLAAGDIDVQVLGFGVPGLGTVTATVLAALNPVLAAVQGLVSPVFGVLGVGFTGSDVSSPPTPSCTPGPPGPSSFDGQPSLAK